MSLHYFLKVASKKHKNKIPGGKADYKKPEDFDKDDLQQGIKVEKEHTTDPDMAEEIAMDHLHEYEDYYDELAPMEAKLEAKKNKEAGLYYFLDRAKKKASSKEMEFNPHEFYTDESQRKWVWYNHPDVATMLEKKQITPNQALDAINSRQGTPTNEARFDEANRMRSNLAKAERDYTK